MQYAYIMPNDFVNGEGVSVSVWMQGCPFHCPGCHNPELWNFSDGKDIYIYELYDKLDKALTANNVHRNLSILGGEPLCAQNLGYTASIINWCKETHPESKIYLWTGYYFDELSPEQHEVAVSADTIIDGRYVESQRDVSLHLRGSRNQNILRKGEQY